MVPYLPLSTLLSQVLVAFTIEFDNEFEHRMPHRTTHHGATSDSDSAPWLASLVMWSNCMKFVGKEGITIGELQRLAYTETNLDGMRRWGYIIIEAHSTGKQSKPLRSDSVLRPTTKGQIAKEVWQPLPDIIEKRWQERFGKNEIDRIRKSLWAVTSQIDIKQPDCLPILGYELFSKGRNFKDDRFLVMMDENERRALAEREGSTSSRLPLFALLSRVLLAFAIEFERKSEVSLAISANVLRVLNEKGVQVRELPHLTGVSKEAISMAMGILQNMRLAIVEQDPDGSRFKVVRLTPKGLQAQDASHRLLRTIEDHWQERFGKENIHNLRESLEWLVNPHPSHLSPLFKGLEPYPDGWRASVPKPDTLPHYPMVLHRGGFPDGS